MTVETNMENLIWNSINSYSSNLICLSSAHKLRQDIGKVLSSDIMQETFVWYLKAHSVKYPTEKHIIEQFLRDDYEAMSAFQLAYDDLKMDIAGNYPSPTKEDLQKINDKIQIFAKKRRQYDRRLSLSANNKQHAA